MQVEKQSYKDDQRRICPDHLHGVSRLRIPLHHHQQTVALIHRVGLVQDLQIAKRRMGSLQAPSKPFLATKRPSDRALISQFQPPGSVTFEAQTAVTGNYMVVDAFAVPQTILPAVPDISPLPCKCHIIIHFFLNSFFFLFWPQTLVSVLSLFSYAKISASSWLRAAPSSVPPLALRNTIAVIDIASCRPSVVLSLHQVSPSSISRSISSSSSPNEPPNPGTCPWLTFLGRFCSPRQSKGLFAYP